MNEQLANAMTATMVANIPPPTVTSVLPVLAEARMLVEPAYRAATKGLTQRMRLIAGYNAGWWDEHGRPSTNVGKAVRPALVLGAAKAVGAHDLRVCVPEAIAVEMIHDFSLLHDDFMDGDLRRRSRPTAWSIFGASSAILAGDSLLALAAHQLAERPSNSVLVKTLLALCAGQSADLEFEAASVVTLDECLKMVEAKTASLLSCACEIGAVAAGATSGRQHLLSRFGHHLGMAFQLYDDILGIWGDPSVTGKPVHSDLINRKKSPPIVVALQSNSRFASDLEELYAQPCSKPETIQRMAVLIERTGARAWVEQRARDELSAALDCLSEVATREAAQNLSLLAALVTRRSN